MVVDCSLHIPYSFPCGVLCSHQWADWVYRCRGDSSIYWSSSVWVVQLVSSQTPRKSCSGSAEWALPSCMLIRMKSLGPIKASLLPIFFLLPSVSEWLGTQHRTSLILSLGVFNIVTQISTILEVWVTNWQVHLELLDIWVYINALVNITSPQVHIHTSNYGLYFDLKDGNFFLSLFLLRYY